MTKNIVMDLPEDILAIIFSRLPLISIMNLCDVRPSIEWCRKIVVLYCRSRQSTLFLGVNKTTGQEEIIEYRHNANQIVSTKLNSLNLIRRDEKLSLSRGFFNIVCSCNGLLLYNGIQEPGDYYVKTLRLVNPIVQRNATVYKSGPVAITLYNRRYGLGYSSTTRRYKVVRFGISDNMEDGHASITRNDDDIALVLTIDHVMGNNWRSIVRYSSKNQLISKKIVSSWIPFLQRAVSLGGAIHWLVKSHNVILRFDVDEEELDLLLLPYNRESNHFFNQLSVLDGSLCALAATNRPRSCPFSIDYHCLDNPWLGMVEVWIMKEYGVKESWARLATISLQVCKNIMELKLIRILENGKFLIQQDDLLRLYDPIDEKWDEKTLMFDDQLRTREIFSLFA